MSKEIRSGEKDLRIDDYIERRAAFAKPILIHLRKLVHKACPLTEESIKWGFPHFSYTGEMLCYMASFKQHCAFGFWKASLMKKNKALEITSRAAMGNFGKISELKDLPPDKEIVSLIKEAAELIDKGIKVKKQPKPESSGKDKIELPDYFKKQLHKNKKALETFIAFSPSHKREYLEWITEAKTEATRERRMATAIEWLSEGKSRNWKYIKK